MYPDGAGLYLQVTGAAAKSWVLRYSLRGKAREMGLGSLRKVTLADARRKAAECHKLLDGHVDPIEHRAQARAAAALANATSITFKEAAARYIAMRSKGLKNAKHAAQWGTTIATYAEPILGKLLVRDIDVGHVHQVLEPIWTTKPETGREGARTHRKNSRLGQGEQLPGRGEPRPMARQPRSTAAQIVGGAEGQAPSSAALRRIAGIHGKTAKGGRQCGTGARIYDPDGRAHRGSNSSQSR